MDEKTFDTIDREIGVFIRRIVLSEKRNDTLGRSTYILLGLLHEEGPASVKMLANRLQLDVSTVSRQAAGMEKKGFVHKLPNPEDGRSYFYQISERGKKDLLENRTRRLKRVRKVLEGWTDEESQVFGRLLQKYNKSVQERL
ncbi:MarR family transcriptional regulator [Virgibacillus sp. 179-BFC.A HS]|uniref:MarR family transcriptional regulator n=1 Tax=Tigheibacillus jepli TaxID=3035914 RepID=A0ABU5CDG6_9BACI|nr:MarR family transcriptional regulator [Virgibacillus sp. 179-BFC.A HS]MDY0404349.1 MarR family transcriptional regulator [Virgibacillus sp. 179-BFC.A HS]